MPYKDGDSREVVVIDHRNDARLRQIESAAAAALWDCVKDGALACVQVDVSTCRSAETQHVLPACRLTPILQSRKTNHMINAQALARVVSEHLGGPSAYAELSERHREAVTAVKKARQSLVIPIGELPIGVSRHRSLLLKALMDECGFACRILRGSYLLGVHQ